MLIRRLQNTLSLCPLQGVATVSHFKWNGKIEPVLMHIDTASPPTDFTIPRPKTEPNVIALNRAHVTFRGKENLLLSCERDFSPKNDSLLLCATSLLPDGASKPRFPCTVVDAHGAFVPDRIFHSMVKWNRSQEHQVRVGVYRAAILVDAGHCVILHHCPPGQANPSGIVVENLGHEQINVTKYEPESVENFKHQRAHRAFPSSRA